MGRDVDACDVEGWVGGGEEGVDVEGDAACAGAEVEDAEGFLRGCWFGFCSAFGMVWGFWGGGGLEE